MSFSDYLHRLLEMIERIRTMEIVSETQTIIFGALLVFGLLNCVLGYRLLRFWVMLFGFAAGALAGFLIVRRLEVPQKIIYLGAMVGLGIILAVIAFLIYKAGIFLLAAGLGMTAGIYFFRPTTSAMFFLCILMGVALGILSVRYSRGVIIIATSLMGGAIAGLSLGKIGSLPEIPYGIGMSAGFALLGMLVQFTINRPEIEDEEEESYEDSGETDKRRARSADSIDFRLPGGYDEVYYDYPEETYERPSGRKKKNRDNNDGFHAAGDL